MDGVVNSEHRRKLKKANRNMDSKVLARWRGKTLKCKVWMQQDRRLAVSGRRHGVDLSDCHWRPLIRR